MLTMMVECLTAENLVADDVELHSRPLTLCLDSVISCLLHDDTFTDTAFVIFDKFKSL